MSSSGSHEWFEEGGQQIRAGVALIVWSRLALWNAQDLALVAASEAEFESAAGHKEVRKELGRLICWIAFGVGGEYLAKGACLLNGCDLSKEVKVIRPPSRDEHIESWIALVSTKDPAVDEYDLTFGTLGKLEPSLRQIVKASRERDLVLASIKLLASTIRNRDAHRYAHNVRAFHFHAVESLFIPAFNILLRSLDQEELRVRLLGLVIR